MPFRRTVAGGTGGNIGFGTVIDKNLASGTITAGSVAPATLGGPHAFVSNDGSTGDYTDIQTAINDTFGVGGGIVFIRDGTYLLTADIIIYDNITLVGETAGGVILDFQTQAHQLKLSGVLIDSTGTVAISNNSMAVTGTSTVFTAGMVGDSILLKGRWFTIATVADTTHLTIDSPFDADAVSGQANVIGTPVVSSTLQNFTVQNSTHTNGSVYFAYTQSCNLSNVSVLSSTIGLNFLAVNNTTAQQFFTSGCGTGVKVSNSAVWTMYNFECYGSTGVNLLCDTFYNMSVSNATISSATGNNITLTSCAAAAFYDMENTTAGAKAIELISCTDIEIFAMAIRDAVSDGIKLTSGCSRVGISTNVTLINNGGYGINIADNTSSSNGVVGVFYSGNTAGTINDSGVSTYKVANVPDSTTTNNFITDTDGTLTANSDLKLATQKATKTYVDAAVLGQNFKEAVKYASTAALPTVVYSSGAGTLTGFAVGAISLDGSSPVVGNRILIKNQVSTFQNGLYTVTATGSGIAVFVLTRTSDANTSVEFKTGDSVFVTAGSTLTSTTWAYTGIDSPNFTSDAITYVQVAGQGSFTGGNGISITGTSIAIDTSVTADKTTAQALTNKDLSSGTNTFPTFNQNTTGSAAKWTTARNLAGNSVDGSAAVAFANKFVVQGTADAGLSSAQFLGALSTGIVKNTTTTGVLSIATNADLPAMTASVGGAVPTPPNNTTTFLRGDATWAAPSTSGFVGGPGSSVNNDIATFSGTSGTVIQDSGKLLPTGTVVGTTDTQTLSGKIVGDAFMGNAFNSQNALVENLTLTASTNFTYDNLLEIGASNTLEIPATSTLEIEVYVDQAAFATQTGTAPDANNSFMSQSRLNQNVTLPVSTDFLVTNLLDIGVSSTIEIPATSSLEIQAPYDSSSVIPSTHLSNPYKFSVYRNAAWNTGTGSQFNIVSFDTKTFDTGNNTDTISNVGRFTAPVAGFYQFEASVGTATTNIWLIAAFYKNGTIAKKGQGVFNAAGVINSYNVVTGLFQLSAKDYIEVFLYSSGATQTGLTGATETYFDGFLVSLT